MNVSLGGGAILLDTADYMHGSLYNRRVTSCGSVASGYDMRGSQTSMRHGSRFSCVSGVRDEQQTIDEFRRKQRVIRYMEEEREQAERGKIERGEHLDWVNFRQLERQERFKLLSVEEVSEILRREAQDVERERLLVEEALRRGTEAALQRQRAAASVTPRTESLEKVETVSREDKAVGGEQKWADASPNTRSVGGDMKNFNALKSEYRQREEELLSKLRIVQNEAAAARAAVNEAKEKLAAAEEKQLRQSARIAQEAVVRKEAEARVNALETELDVTLKKMLAMEEQTQTMINKDGENASKMAKLEQQLKAKQQQLVSLQHDNADLTEKCKKLSSTNDILTGRLNMRQNNVLGKQPQQQLEGNKSSNTRSPPSQQLSARNDPEALGEKRSFPNTARSFGEGHAWQKGEPGDKNVEVKIERLEQLEKDAMMYKAEAEAARRKLNEMRESYDKEIASLQEWCSRLNEKCNRQTEELRDRMSRGEMDNFSGGRGNDAASGKGGPATLPEMERAEYSAKIAGLMQELNETRTQLKESQEKEKNAVYLLNIVQNQARNNQAVTKDKSAGVCCNYGSQSGGVGESRQAEGAGHRGPAVDGQRWEHTTATAQNVPCVAVPQLPDGFGAVGAAARAADNTASYGAQGISADAVSVSQELNSRVPVVGEGGQKAGLTAQDKHTRVGAESASSNKTCKKTKEKCCFFCNKKN